METWQRILLIRFGALGDVIHALPVAATMRRYCPNAKIAWMIEPKWRFVLEGNPHLDQIIELNRRSVKSVLAGLRETWKFDPDVCLDLQGLIKSAVAAKLSDAPIRFGFDSHSAREPIAAVFYTHATSAKQQHAVDRGLALALAAGAVETDPAMPLPPGKPEGDLPAGPFVLACPVAGWTSKQWPIEYYRELAHKLQQTHGLPLVVNGSEADRTHLEAVTGAVVHCSSIHGLLDATRRAALVVGVDSGPLHIAAALGQTGVAIFGPTDPARNGPRGGKFVVLRDRAAETSYRRESEIAESMKRIVPEMVFQCLNEQWEQRSVRKAIGGSKVNG